MNYPEKRKAPRADINIKLTIESLYKTHEDMIEGIDEAIVVHNISKTGLGFEAVHDLPLGYHFNASIVIDDKHHFFSVLKIVRKEPIENGFNFGCEFIGLADVLSDCLEDLM
ncbi:MAG: PilZ domain-containing protein [Clostridia bacterium]|nr:PilZ domain-containing protein [Clostridia bacterium]